MAVKPKPEISGPQLLAVPAEPSSSVFHNWSGPGSASIKFPSGSSSPWLFILPPPVP